jgi:hypothetical protein
MPPSEATKNLNFNSGGCYRICVKGFLDGSWSERLSGMRIINQDDGIISPLVTLEGPVLDQTELIGVLNNLYEMHLPVVSVALLDD